MKTSLLSSEPAFYLHCDNAFALAGDIQRVMTALVVECDGSIVRVSKPEEREARDMVISNLKLIRRVHKFRALKESELEPESLEESAKATSITKVAENIEKGIKSVLSQHYSRVSVKEKWSLKERVTLEFKSPDVGSIARVAYYSSVGDRQPKIAVSAMGNNILSERDINALVSPIVRKIARDSGAEMLEEIVPELTINELVASALMNEGFAIPPVSGDRGNTDFDMVRCIEVTTSANLGAHIKAQSKPDEEESDDEDAEATES